MKLTCVRALILVAAVVVLLPAVDAHAQSAGVRIDHTVRVAGTRERLFHVTTEVRNLRQEHVTVSLPTWTPGWYTIENYAKNMLRFRATDSKGNRLRHLITRKQTWRIETAGVDHLRIDFDYSATTLALNQARIADDFAFFTGTQLFLMVEGHRNRECSVRFEIPDGWNIATALKDTGEPRTFTAVDYDVLVDAPTLLGKFDQLRFDYNEKPHVLLTVPAGAFPRSKAEEFARILEKIATTQKSIFNDLPYEKYLYFYFFLPPESNASGGLEHLNSYIAFAQPGADPDGMAGLAAHEFFHVWNVKRIRPIEMWPYDYSRENETPSLWISEGFTSYYTWLTLYRAGLRPQEGFIQSVASAVNGVESNEVREYISPADASTSTWLGYDTPVAFGISYYTQGQNLGALLDIMIIDDTEGSAGLDDVMRALYRDFYKSNRGFSMQDVITVINRITRRDYSDFFRRHVTGTEIPPYDGIFARAGYRLDKNIAKLPVIGVSARIAEGGVRVTGVTPDSPASRAGLIVGDVITTLDDKPITSVDMSALIGKTVPLRIERNGSNRELALEVGSRDSVSYNLSELPDPTPRQVKVRSRWLMR